MKKTIPIIFTIVTCMTLASVALIQVVCEVRQGERIQAFDLITDTFSTPGRRIVNLKKEFAALLTACTSVRDATMTTENRNQLAEHGEAILAGAESIRTILLEINRHVVDSATDVVRRCDSLVEKAQRIRATLDNEEQDVRTRSVDLFTESVMEMQHKYVGSESVPAFLIRTIHAFFRTTFFSTRYIRAYEKNLEKRSAVAQTVRPIMQFFRYAILRDAGDKVLIGKRGWLFYRPDVEYLYRPSVFDRRSKITDYNDKALTDDPLAVIVDFKEQLSRRGIDLLVVVVPGKPSVYPDLLAGCGPPLAGNGYHPSAEFIDSLHRHNIDVVDLFAPFYKERLRDETEADSFYLKQDTHWKSRGLRTAAGIVAERIKEYSWFPDAHKTARFALDTEVVQREGDIANMTDLINNPFERLRVSFPAEATTCYKVQLVSTDFEGNILRTVRYRDDYKNARILILGDSFSRIYQTDIPGSAGWIAHLAYDLSEQVASLVNDGGASTLVREKLARKSTLLKGKKLVVWEFVERDIRYGAFGWKVVKLP